MSHPITIPKLGLTMEEATIVEWARADGEQVSRGETVFTIETDKIMFDVEAEHDGFVQRLAAIGDVVQISAVVGHLHENAQAALSAAGGAAPASAAAVSGAGSQPAEPGATRTAAAAPTTTPTPTATPEGPATVAGRSGNTIHPASLAVPVDESTGRLMVSPVARKIAAERKLDLHAVSGSGPGGVILKRDVERAPAPAAAPAPASASSLTPAMPATSTAPAASQTRRPLSGMRRAIAQRMLHSLATKAQMTGFGRVDMAEAMKMRETLVAAQAELGARITYTDLVLKAAATVLVAMPEVSAYIDGNEIVSCSGVHIGLAVALDAGLIVPVIRHVDRLSLVELSLARQELIDKARAGKLSREDVEGGSFTVSNFGSYGGDFETPILNAPQSALLGIGQITDEAVVRDKQIVIRPMMSISLTFDHALIDGSVAGDFRARFKAMLETPALLLARLR